MQQNFAASLALVLQSEGGYVDNPHDPGGATNKGVTQRVFDAYRRFLDMPPASVKFIGATDVSSIYRRQYWDAVKGDDLPSGVDYAVFDEAVNSGTSRAVKDLQAVLRVKADGQLGLVTIMALRSANPRTVVNAICDYRLTFLRRLKTFAFFGKGWTNRVAAVRAAALKLETP